MLRNMMLKGHGMIGMTKFNDEKDASEFCSDENICGVYTIRYWFNDDPSSTAIIKSKNDKIASVKNNDMGKIDEGTNEGIWQNI